VAPGLWDGASITERVLLLMLLLLLVPMLLPLLLWRSEGLG